VTEEELQALVAADYLALAALLDGLPVERWDTPSMCTEWRVREVVAHVTMAARYDEAAFMAELRDAQFDFPQVSNRIAARDAQLPIEELVTNLRSDVLHQWQPPGGGASGALNHVVVHGLDITVPLGVPRRSPDETIRIVLEGLTRGGVHDHFGTDVSGRTLTATDIDWSFGSGPRLSGSAEDLVLHLCGRAVPAERLDGEELSRSGQ
jgi:uncharacterized protein (TIGR03083 family)